MLYEKMISKMRIEAELHGIFMLHFLMLYTLTVQYVGETGDESYTGELIQSPVCQAGTRENSLTNINL